MTELTSEISKILATHDPDSWISIGAPSDEYWGYAEAIAAKLPTNPSVEEIEAIISDALERSDFEMTNWTEKKIVKTAPPAERLLRVKAAASEIHKLLVPR